MGIHNNDTIERVMQSQIRWRHRIDVLNQIEEVITNYAPKDSRMQRMSGFESVKKTHSCQGSVQLKHGRPLAQFTRLWHGTKAYGLRKPHRNTLSWLGLLFMTG